MVIERTVGLRADPSTEAELDRAQQGMTAYTA